MKEKIFNILKTSTFKHTGIVSFATIINGILGFIFFWLIARIFTASTLGGLMTAITFSSLLTDLTTLGTETGVVNFVGKFIKTDKNKAFRFLKLALKVKVIVSILVLTIGWPLMPTIASLLGKTELTSILKLSLFAAVGGLLFGFSASSLQALQRFYQWGFINIFSNAGRLIFTYIFFILGLLTINSNLIVYSIFPLLAFFLSFIFLPNFIKVKNENSVFKDFFHYNKWVTIFTFIAATSSSLDVLLIAKLKPLSDVGIYSVAKTLTAVIPQIVGAIGTVIAPKLAGLDTKMKAINYLKKLQLFVGALSISGIISGSIIGFFFIKHFYLPTYITSFSPFVILLIAQAIFLFSVPVHMTVIYYFSYPKLFVLVSIVNILIVGVGGYILISNFGIIGGAMAVLIGNIFNFIIPAIWTIRKFNKL